MSQWYSVSTHGHYFGRSAEALLIGFPVAHHITPLVARFFSRDPARPYWLQGRVFITFPMGPLGKVPSKSQNNPPARKVSRPTKPSVAAEATEGSGAVTGWATATRGVDHRGSWLVIGYD